MKNQEIHSIISRSTDAASRARDDLGPREADTEVSIYTLDQIERAIEGLYAAYAGCMQNNFRETQDAVKLCKRLLDFELRTASICILPDVLFGLAEVAGDEKPTQDLPY